MNIETSVKCKEAKALSHRWMLDVVDARDEFGQGVADADRVIKERRESANGDVREFINGGAEGLSGVLTEILRIVGPSAEEAHPQWCPRNYHRRPSARAYPEPGVATCLGL